MTLKRILTYWPVLIASVSSLLLKHPFTEQFVPVHDLTLAGCVSMQANEYFADSNVAIDRSCIKTALTDLLKHRASS
jgi:hypothetical protein